MIFFHHSMTEAPTPIRISHGPKIPKPFQSKSGSPFEVGTEPPTPIRISHRWKINPISSNSEIIGTQKLNLDSWLQDVDFFQFKKDSFEKKILNPKKSKSGSDELMILLVIWAFFPSPVCICHWCISIGWLHQTLENVMAITSFCPIDISHSSIGIRVGLRKVARVVSIGIVTSHILQKKGSWWLFCVFLAFSWKWKAYYCFGPFDVNRLLVPENQLESWRSREEDLFSIPFAGFLFIHQWLSFVKRLRPSKYPKSYYIWYCKGRDLIYCAYSIRPSWILDVLGGFVPALMDVCMIRLMKDCITCWMYWLHDHHHKQSMNTIREQQKNVWHVC